MDEITKILQAHYARTFEAHGATAKGVDWNDESEVLVRYDKMLAVLQKDFAPFASAPSLLDVGSGWGGMLRRAKELGIPLRYTGIDVVEEMIKHGKQEFKDAEFLFMDVFDLPDKPLYDFVVCNAILTQKLSVSIIKMERYLKEMALKMFKVCRHGIAFNVMSTRVNFTVNNLYYHNPSDLLSWLLEEVSPRVRLDHGYSSLNNGKGKFYDYTVYVYKD